jgi:hypothetical protein
MEEGLGTEAQVTPEEGRALINQELERLADGDPQRLWRLKKFQASIDRELRPYKDPVARMNKMVELFWTGVKKFHSTIS